MSDIELACHLSPWGHRGFIHALADIEQSGFRGIETSSDIVEMYEDRVGVFTEILTQHRLNLIAITAGGARWPGMNLDEEVERNLNYARFLRSAGARYLTLYPPRPNPESPIEDELDLMPAATAYGEIARRTIELDVLTCLHPDMHSCVDNPRILNKFIQMADPEALKLCVDSSWLFEAGVPVAPFIKEHHKRLGLVHLRDVKPREHKAKKPATHRKGKEPARTPGVELGKGHVNLPGFVKALLAADYVGWATVEFDAIRDHSLLETARACHLYTEQKLDLVL
jgi:sugar phosphate isomerase/epimerase